MFQGLKDGCSKDNQKLYSWKRISITGYEVKTVPEARQESVVCVESAHIDLTFGSICVAQPTDWNAQIAFL